MKQASFIIDKKPNNINKTLSNNAVFETQNILTKEEPSKNPGDNQRNTKV